ncbi:MAG: UTP--glucose-1-phosphate uridylyltransferase [Verrucomicrobia bacterium]|nr:UTP--glucose-1-phosphate uridylyltransferase [Verrucomicrobiota bacterium]
MVTYREIGNAEEIALGHSLIKEGKVGCIVLAGGDGSRLGWDGPKGTFPVWNGKTLFQMLQETVAKASTFYGRELKLAVMTSPINDAKTKEAFLPKVDFFTQQMLPLLDSEGQPLDELRPNGNGEALKCFYRSGLFEQWRKSGVEFVQVILVDNLLANPFDPNLIGIHAKTQAEVCIKTVRRTSAEEKVGVVGRKGGRICVIEYSEKPPPEWNLASIGLFSFSMDFVEKVKDVELPIHLVNRTFDGKPVIKREYFLFDLLPYSVKTEVILYPREMTFAPLKNREDLPLVSALFEKNGKQWHQGQC